MEEKKKQQPEHISSSSAGGRSGLKPPPDNLRKAASFLKMFKGAKIPWGATISEIRENEETAFRYRTLRKRLIWSLILVLGAVVTAIGLFLSVRMLLNGVFLIQYNHGQYSYQPEKVLTGFNIPEGYVPLYNCGNIAYQKEEYAKAVSYYKKALAKNPAHPKECAIRINLALAMLHEIEYDDPETEAEVRTVLNQLYAARDILTEEDCADPDVIGEGETADPEKYHSEEAEKLKEEIDRKISELQEQTGETGRNEQDSQNEEEDSSDEDSSGQSKQTSREQQIEQKLEKRQEEAQKEYNESIGSQTIEGGRQDDGEEGDGSGWMPAENW